MPSNPCTPKSKENLRPLSEQLCPDELQLLRWEIFGGLKKMESKLEDYYEKITRGFERMENLLKENICTPPVGPYADSTIQAASTMDELYESIKSVKVSSTRVNRHVVAWIFKGKLQLCKASLGVWLRVQLRMQMFGLQTTHGVWIDNTFEGPNVLAVRCSLILS